MHTTNRPNHIPAAEIIARETGEFSPAGRDYIGARRSN